MSIEERQRKQSEKYSTLDALRASEERYRTLYQNNPSMFFTVDAGGIVISVNEFGASQLGYSIEELEGQSVLKVFYEDDKMAALQHVQTCLEYPGQLYRWQLRKICKDGSLLWVEEFARAVHSPNNEPQVLIMCQDITERKRAETQQLELALAEERTALLREFLHTLSHDLKTPLSVINTSVYLLNKTFDPERKQHLLGEILSQSQYLEKLIADIHTVSRLDTVPDFTLSSVNLLTIIYEIMSQFQVIAEERSIKLVLEVDEDLPPVLANEIDLQRALLNLVENALHYTAYAGRVTVRLWSETETILMEVRDTGIGIDEADIPYIFDPFYRTEKARTSNGRGTGLGLAIVKKTIERHGGKIEVKSKIAKGSVFRIRLPLIENLATRTT